MHKKYSSTRVTKPRSTRRTWIIVAAVLVIVCLVGVVLELTGVTHWIKEESQSSTIQSTTTSEPFTIDTPAPAAGSTEEPTPPPNDKTGASEPPTVNTSEPPASPSGNFVSNHYPNLGGNPAPTAMQSICSTTPGASCTITFTNQDGVVKTLSAQVTDISGTTSWNWDIKKAGFTAGTWEIKATATIGDHHVSTIDPLKLEVQP